MSSLRRAFHSGVRNSAFKRETSGAKCRRLPLFTLALALVALFSAPQLSRAELLRGGRVEWKSVPDVLVTTHEGKTVRFNTDLVAGRIAVIDFIYTDCTFICTPQGRTFAGLSELLGERLGREVVLISVSLAPKRDTPAALKKWVTDLGGPHSGWSLVTGDEKEVGKLIRSLAGFVSRQYHDGNAVIVDERTRTRLYFSGTEAPQSVLRKLSPLLAQRQ